jgi:hypothetical protein
MRLNVEQRIIDRLISLTHEIRQDPNHVLDVN